MKFFGVHFVESQNLFILLPILIISCLMLLKWYFWKVNAISILTDTKNSLSLFENFSLSKNRIKFILMFLALIFLAISLLRPQWGASNEIVHQKGRDLLIAIDISRSMLCEDVKPNRLEFAKEKIKKLVKELKSERIGLIVFSGDALVQCPLTTDIESFFSFIDLLDVETISSGSTALDSPIKKAVEIFQSNPSKKTKLLVMYTDGEDFSQDLEKVKYLAQQVNLKVFTVGIGTQEGAPIPIYTKSNQKSYQKDKDGNIVISKLNASILEDLSNITGAFYVYSDENDKDIDLITSRVKKFEKETFDDVQSDVLEEKYYYFAAISLVFFLLNWLL